MYSGGQQEIRIGKDKKYKINVKVGQGAFGDVYQGININNGQEVAIKLENCQSTSL